MSVAFPVVDKKGFQHLLSVDKDIYGVMSAQDWKVRHVGDKIVVVLEILDGEKIDTKYGHRVAAGLYNLLPFYSSKLVVSAKDGNLLNLTRDNLVVRVKGSWKHGTSQYMGVMKGVKEGSFRAVIRVKGNQIYIGTFYNERKAAEAWDLKARFYGRPESSLNFPNEAGV